MKKLFGIISLIILTITAPAGKKDASPAFVKASEIKIIPERGRITERFDAGGDKLVVHIQDAHTNYEAQKNSAGIIEDLINKYGLSLILVEGRSSDVSLNRYREQFPLERRKEIAEKSLKKGIIAGEEYLNIISDYPMKLQGIEDGALYDQNMKAFLEIDKAKDSALLYARLLSGAVSSLKVKLYNKALRELDEKMIGFKREAVALNDYVGYLNRLAKSKKINLSAYQNYKNLIDSIDLEGEIDFAAVEKEKAEVIDLLSRKIGQDELNGLFMSSVDFKSGKLTQSQYHNYLKGIMGKAGLDIKKHPNLDKYVVYVTTYEKIESAALFRELRSIEDVVEQGFAAGGDQRQFLKIAKNLELLMEFIDLKLSPDDFDYYLKNEADFDITAWVRFLNSRLIKYKLAEKVPEAAQTVEKVIPSLKNFYIIARKRDEAFLDNTGKYMDEGGVNIAVLIAGGFHTPTLMRLFRANKISYVVISPKVIKPTDEKLYHKVLTEGWAPAE